MEKTISVLQDKSKCLSFVSFRPLIKYLKEKQFKKDNDSKDCDISIEEIFLASDLTVHDTELSIIRENDVVIKSMLNKAFSELDPKMDFYAIAAPFSNNIIYSSDRYKSFFSVGKLGQYVINEAVSFLQTNLEITYQLILKKFYGLTLIHNNTFVCPITQEASCVQKFLEFELVPDFIEITLIDNLPPLDIADLSKFFSQIKCYELLKEVLPLHLFSVEGIVLIRVRDVTMRECTGMIKNILLAMPYFSDSQSFENLQKQVQNLIELPEATISLTSIIRDHTCGMNLKVGSSNSLLLQPISFTSGDSSAWLQLKELFKERTSLIISNFSSSFLHQFQFLQSYDDNGVKSLVLFPLKFGVELMGIFSIVTKAVSIKQHHLYKIEPLIPLLVLALEKQSEKMDDEIDRVIKEQFTAVQSSVNWKFNETACNYIIQNNKGQDSKIESIVFENVFPLYGSIDVRNSSIERSTAIQKDLLEQLQLADAIIRKSKEEIYLFSLQEISYRIDKYISIASLVLFPGDELAIQNFLDDEIIGLFNHLKKVVPAVSGIIDNYFFLLNTNSNKISKQYTAFEESITMINNDLVKFINQEQAKVQQVYAHYFEYFVTDGVDFNIYIGQSITPDKPFDQFYLKNLKLWQLTTLVKAAQKVRNLQHRIPVALDTTQLILAHSKPLSISFRVAERKFDVDGAYNIHYEIIKKRIDKIKITGSCERLTQPGKIAIVFAHDKEAQEYTSYIEYLQKEGLLKTGIEYFELEELPGVRGLKALRVGINMDNTWNECSSLVKGYQLQSIS